MLADQSGAPRGPIELRFARGLLVVLAVVLPFETPLFRLGPLQITTVELALYAALGAWGIALASQLVRDGFALSAAAAALRTETLVQAAALWATVNFASAVAAPSYRAAALKFALRSLSGVLAFFAVRSLARAPEVARRLVLAILTGALLSAATAIVDGLAPGSAPLWDGFRAGRFTAFGLTRASGVFAYPTIGAMYWEAAVPLIVVAPFLGRRSRPGRAAFAGRLFPLLGSALLVGAILASATRSALVGAAVATAALLGLGWSSELAVRRAAAGVLAVVALSSAIPLGTTGFGALLGQRLRWWHDDTWYRAEYRVDATPRTVSVGEVFAVPVTIRNTGTLTWTQGGDQPFRLAYHWVRPDRPMSRSDFEGLRTELPADVPPGGVIELIAQARGPSSEGTYRLHWDLVQEGVTWFSERGNAMPEQRVDVSNAAEAATSLPVAEDTPLPAASPAPPPRPALWRAAVVLWRQHLVLGIGPDNFRRRYQEVLSHAPDGQPYTDTRIHANSFYFETLADLGLAGASALALIGLGLVRLVRAHRATRRLAGLGVGVAAGAFFVHGALDYFLEFTPLFCLFWMLLGLTAACGPKTSSSEALAGNTP
jgi:O-Antigen ligase